MAEPTRLARTLALPLRVFRRETRDVRREGRDVRRLDAAPVLPQKPLLPLRFFASFAAKKTLASLREKNPPAICELRVRPNQNAARGDARPHATALSRTRAYAPSAKRKTGSTAWNIR